MLKHIPLFPPKLINQAKHITTYPLTFLMDNNNLLIALNYSSKLGKLVMYTPLQMD